MPEIINTMVVVDIPEGLVADGIFVSVVGDVFVLIVGDDFVTSIPLVVVVVFNSLLVSIFCVVETDKFLLPTVELPSVELSRSSGTRILKWSLSLKYFYFEKEENSLQIE